MPIIGFSIGQLHSSLLLLTIFTVSNTMLAMHGSYADVVTKQFTSLNPRSGNRFLAGKGTRCNSGNAMECTVPNGSTDQLRCCSKMCTDVLSDSKNCGSCGKQCPFGQLCCMGTCTTVAYDEENCGSCGVVCQNGSMCTYGFCGYATWDCARCCVMVRSILQLVDDSGVSLLVYGQKLSVQLGLVCHSHTAFVTKLNIM